MHAADGVENPVHVEEESTEEGGWKITSSVNAVPKLTKYNQNVRRLGGDVTGWVPGDFDNEHEEEKKRIATTAYVAPSLISMCRRDNSTAPSPFVTAFW